MKIVSLIAMFSFFFFLNVNAEKGEETQETTRFEIMVIDANTEEPLPAARIKIEQKNLEAFTDFDGLYAIDDLPKGIYSLEISFISYQKYEVKDLLIDQSSNKILVKLQD